MDEKANIRLTLLCATAATLPINKVRTIIADKISVQTLPTIEKQTENSLYKAAIAAVLTMVAMKAVIGVGAPSYTSGAQKWNGAAEILKPKPINNIITPTNSMDSLPPLVMTERICIKSKLPDIPYINAMPNSKKPEANAPIKKYLNADSLEEISSLLLPASTYMETDKISTPIKSITKLVYDTITSAPTSVKKTRAKRSVVTTILEKKSSDIINHINAVQHITIVKARA